MASREARREAKLAAAQGAVPWDRCMQWLAAKRRFCSMARAPGAEHCGNHRPEGVAGDGAALSERMPCPVDPTHTIFVRDRRAHVRVCNKSKRRAEAEALPCYAVGVNHGACETEEDAAAIRELRAQAAGVGAAADAQPVAGRKRPAPVLRGPPRGGSGDGEDDGDGDGDDDAAAAGDEDDAAAVAAAARASTSLLHRLIRSGAVDIAAFAARVQRWHDAHVGTLPTHDASESTPAGTALLTAARAGAGGVESRSVYRHEAQQASIVSHMSASGLLPIVHPPLLLQRRQQQQTQLSQQQNLQQLQFQQRGAPASSCGDGESVGAEPPLSAPLAPLVAPPAELARSSSGDASTSPMLLVEFGAGRGLLSRTVSAFVEHAAACGASDGSAALAPRPGSSTGPVVVNLAAASSRVEELLPRDDTVGAGACAPVRDSACQAAVVAPHTYLLIDRGASKGKADRQLGMTTLAPPSTSQPARAPPAAPYEVSTVRLRLDIAHFDLARQPHAWPPGCSCPPSSFAPAAAVSANHGLTTATSTGAAPCALQGAPASGAPASPPGPAAAPPAVHVVGYGKHLCGVATDLALRCLARSLGGDGEAPPVPTARPPHTPRLRGVAIATCCHHVCAWRHYVGRAWWMRALGATARDFELARMLSSWCVDGTSGGGGSAEGEVAVPLAPSGVSAAPATAATSLAAPAGGAAAAAAAAGAAAATAPPIAVDRRLLGRQCKRLIDAGRAWYLAAAFGAACALPAPAGVAGGGAGGGNGEEGAVGGMAGRDRGSAGSAATVTDAAVVRLVHYCDPRVSPENALLLFAAAGGE